MNSTCFAKHNRSPYLPKTGIIKTDFWTSTPRHATHKLADVIIFFFLWYFLICHLKLFLQIFSLFFVVVKFDSFVCPTKVRTRLFHRAIFFQVDAAHSGKWHGTPDGTSCCDNLKSRRYLLHWAMIKRSLKVFRRSPYCKTTCSVNLIGAY